MSIHISMHLPQAQKPVSVLLSAAKCQRLKNYFSFSCLLFHLIYALLTPITVQPSPSFHSLRPTSLTPPSLSYLPVRALLYVPISAYMHYSSYLSISTYLHYSSFLSPLHINLYLPVDSTYLYLPLCIFLFQPTYFTFLYIPTYHYVPTYVVISLGNSLTSFGRRQK